MLGNLAALDSDTALRRRLRHYAAPRLLVIDEVGYLSSLYENAKSWQRGTVHWKPTNAPRRKRLNAGEARHDDTILAGFARDAPARHIAVVCTRIYTSGNTHRGTLMSLPWRYEQ